MQGSLILSSQQAARAFLPSKAAQRLGIFSILLLFLSFHLWGVKVFVVEPGIKIAPWDIAGMVVVYVWLNHTLVRGSPAPQVVKVGIGLMLAFLIWITFQALRSAEVAKSMTLVMLLVRDFVLFITIAALANYIQDVKKLNRWMFLLGAGIAAVSVLLFALNYDMSGAVRRPFGGMILMFDSGRIPRLLGFANDPNFYALFISISLFCGLVERRLNWVIKWAGVAVIFAAIALTISRSAFVAIPAAIFVISVYYAFTQRGISGSIWNGIVKTLVIILVISIGAFYTLTSVIQPLDKWTSSRFSNFTESPRINLWSQLLEDPYVFIAGEGLRSARTTLGRSSHNGYLDILFETGVVGIGLWLAFAIFLLRKGFHLVKHDPDSIPWMQGVLVVMLMMATLSTTYHPIFWVTSAVVLARYGQFFRQNTPDRETPEEMVRLQTSPHAQR